MQLTNMNIRKMRLALLAHASFMPFDKNKLSHKVLCALSSVALIESAEAAEKAILNVTTGAGNTAVPLSNSISSAAGSTKELWITSNVPIVSTANHTYAGATVIGQKAGADGAAVQTAATFYNMGQIGSAGKSFTINPNGVLRGSGTVVGNVTNAGKVSPGNNGVTSFVGEPSLPVGTTMAINGNYASTGQTWLYFAPAIGSEPSKGDNITIIGAFDPSTGKLHITPRPGHYPSATPVTHTAITWAGAAAPGTWHSRPPSVGASDMPTNIVITTADSALSNYLELNVTATQTSSGLSFTFAGVDRNLASGSPVNPADLTSVTGAIKAASGATIASTAGTVETPVTTAISTKLEIAEGGSANIEPAANSTVEFSGEIAGGNLNLSSGEAGSAVKFTGYNPGYTGTVAATGVKAVFNGNMSSTAIVAGAGSTIGGSGSVGAVNATDSTFSAGNSIGTFTANNPSTSSNSHFKAEMNSTTIDLYNFLSDLTFTNTNTIDVVMEAATYAAGTHTYSSPLMSITGSLLGNVNVLTWVDKIGLTFDIVLDTAATPKTIKLTRTITESDIIINLSQTLDTTYSNGSTYKKRRIITGTNETATSETATSLIGNYNYVTLINGGIISNDSNSNRTLSAPINIAGSGTIATSSGTTTLTGALGSAPTTTLNISGAGTTAITAANPNFLGTVAVGPDATLSLGSSATFDPSATITLSSGTLQLPTGMTLSYPVSSTGTSTINTTGTTTLGSALSNAINTTLSLTGGTTTINHANPGLLGKLNVGSSATLYLGSSANLGASGSATLELISATLNSATANLTGPVNATTSSKINLAGGTNLGSGALTLNTSTLEFVGSDFAGSTAGTTTLTNSGISIAGLSTLKNNVGAAYLGSGALSGSGILKLESENASNITYITANNSGFTGSVNISSKVNIGNGSNLGTGTLTPQAGGEITLGNTTFSNPISMGMGTVATSFTVNPGATATLSGNFSGSKAITASSSDGTGTLNLSGTSSGYTGTIGAANINLMIDGTTGASVNAAAGSIIKGGGTIGAVTLSDNTAMIQPGKTGFETLTISGLSISAGIEPHIAILIDPAGNKRKLKITGGAAADTLENLVVDILYAGGTHPIGTVNYPFLLGSDDGTNKILSKVKKVTWPTQTGISFTVGFDTTGQIIAQSTVTPSDGTSSINIPAATTYSSANRSEATATGLSDARLSSIDTTNYSTTVDTATMENRATAPVNLNSATLTNETIGTKELNAVFATTGTSEIYNANGSETKFNNPVSSPLGSILKITGAGTTTFSNDTNGSLLGAVEVSDSATVNVTNGLGSGAVSLTDTSKLVAQDGATLNNAVSTAANTSITLKPSTNNTVTVNGALSGAGNVYIQAPAPGGTARFNTANTSLSGLVVVNSTTAEIANGANLGTGELNLAGTNPAVIMGDVVLPNPISATVASTFTSNATEKAVLKGAITGNSALTFNGTGMTEIGGTDATYSSPFSGTLYSNAGHLKLNSNASSANVNVGASGTLSGVGTMKDLHLSGRLKPGNSIGTIYVTGNYTAESLAVYVVEIDPTGRSDRTIVTGDATLSGTHIIKPILNAGTYPKGVIEYNILQAGGALTVDQVQINYVAQPNLTFSAGILASSAGSAPVGKTLVLRYENTGDPFTIATDQDAGIATTATIAATAPTQIIIASTDIVSPDSGLSADATAPISPQAELTSIVFQSNSNDITSAATADAFRFKSFSSGMTPSVSGKKNTMEALLTALSKNGPVSYKRNETRLWVTPFVNRSRTNRTSSDLGSQGWSGGSLVGLEQRDKKNTWSLGVLAGLMGSRSHIIGSPDTSSKTNGVLFGAFNTYKYTKKWGHEILASHTTTFIDSQRYGLDSKDKKTPFYAVSNYKSTTDVLNAQINYLFNIIKKKITCRLNTGITYVGSQTGKITERNAGTNGLTTDTSKNSSAELYSGIGVRRIWSVDKITIRTTAVYEYGYQMTSTGPATRTTTHSVVPKTFTTPTGPRQNKHYVQFNSSYLDRNTGLKFILSYSGTLYKNVRNHTGMAKLEYRF